MADIFPFSNQRSKCGFVVTKKKCFEHTHTLHTSVCAVYYLMGIGYECKLDGHDYNGPWKTVECIYVIHTKKSHLYLVEECSDFVNFPYSDF